MTDEEFAARYHVVAKLTAGGAESWHALRTTTQQNVIVHRLVEPGQRRGILDMLDRLSPSAQPRIVERCVVDEIPIIVTDPLPSFTTFADWLQQNVQPLVALPDRQEDGLLILRVAKNSDRASSGLTAFFENPEAAEPPRLFATTPAASISPPDPSPPPLPAVNPQPISAPEFRRPAGPRHPARATADHKSSSDFPLPNFRDAFLAPPEEPPHPVISLPAAIRPPQLRPTPGPYTQVVDPQPDPAQPVRPALIPRPSAKRQPSVVPLLIAVVVLIVAIGVAVVTILATRS